MDIQILLLLAIGAISFINWIVKKSAEARKQKNLKERIDHGEVPVNEPEEEWTQPVPRNQSPSSSGDEAAESMRRLMEALGLPVESEPPKPVRPSPPAIPVAPAQPSRPLFREPVRSEPKVDPYAQDLPPKARPSAPFQPDPREVDLSRRFESAAPLHDWNHPKEAVLARKSPVRHRSVREMLASPGSLREAIILTEILGKPKALR
jgi:hypothetical protein